MSNIYAVGTPKDAREMMLRIRWLGKGHIGILVVMIFFYFVCFGGGVSGCMYLEGICRRGGLGIITTGSHFFPNGRLSIFQLGFIAGLFRLQGA